MSKWNKSIIKTKYNFYRLNGHLPLVLKGYPFFQNQRNGRQSTPSLEQLEYPHKNVLH